MSVEAILILVLFCTGASFVQRVTGFGFGIFIMTALPYIMPSYAEATTLSGLLAMVNSLYLTMFYWKFIPWKKLLPILLTFIVVSFFAVGVVARVDSHVLRHILGVILILVSIYFFRFSERIRLKPTLPVQVAMGTASGLMGGFFAMQGPPAVLYFMSSTDSKDEYAAMAQTYFLIGNFAMTIFRFNQGFVTHAVCVAWIYAVIAVFIGLWLGNMVYRRMPLKVLRKVVYAYIGISGLVAIFS
ncbi:MAG: sulfite exporter TauE/SafE family protein [Bacteroidales bacterium]|nr:sulfite exporter TauE/SafE family protein [Bacteroidales bacterium]